MSDWTSDEHVHLKELAARLDVAFRQQANRGIALLHEEGMRDALGLADGKISLAMFARAMAYEGIDSPKGMLPPEEDVVYRRILGQVIQQAKVAVKAGLLTVREPRMLLPVGVAELDQWMETDHAQHGISVIPGSEFVVRIDEARNWLLSIGARVPRVLGESRLRKKLDDVPPGSGSSGAGAASSPRHDAGAQGASGRAFSGIRRLPERQARWRKAITKHWPDIVRQYGADVHARVVLRYIKAHDTTGYIVPHDRPDELKWKTEHGVDKIVSYKTFVNAVSETRTRYSSRH